MMLPLGEMKANPVGELTARPLLVFVGRVVVGFFEVGFLEVGFLVVVPPVCRSQAMPSRSRSRDLLRELYRRSLRVKFRTGLDFGPPFARSTAPRLPTPLG